MSFSVHLTFSVVAKAHLGLAEADCVLSSGNAIELLKLSLVNALSGMLVAILNEALSNLNTKFCIPEMGSKSQWP